MQNLHPPNYFRQILESPCYAAEFTRMLYEIHIPLAKQLAETLDFQGVTKLMDLGGGSGVISFALLRKHPELESVVVDVENVCKAGRELAAENKLEKRISYLAIDFLQENLPTGFDMVIFCDSGLLNDFMLRKIYAALNPNGRIVIVGQFPPSKKNPASSHLIWAFLNSLEFPSQTIDFTTTDMVQIQLQQAGFRDSSTISVPHEDHLRWNLDWIVVEARK
jgi:ubiquinone/menaquinone biosynthesis C-methylase UbiE